MKLVIIVLSCFVLFAFACQSSNDKPKDPIPLEGDFVFIGTYTKKEGHVDGKGQGIHVYQWNDSTGVLEEHMIIDGIINPSYITLHTTLPIVYAVSEVADNTDDWVGQVYAIAYDLQNKTHSIIGKSNSAGDAPCHIALSSDDQHLLVANYVHGSATAIKLDKKGGFDQPRSSIANIKNTPTTPRQEAAHAHMIQQIPGSNNVLVADLGTDEILTYGLNQDSELTKKHAITVGPNVGPRHFDFHPSLPYVYVLNELKPSITRFILSQGIPFRKIQHLDIPIIKEGDPVYSSAIKVHPDGSTLYAATRGLDGTEQNEIVVVSIDEESRMRIIQTISTQGEVPRDFTITPSGNYIIAGNQDSDDVSVFRTNADRTLTHVRTQEDIPTPVCFVWK